MTYREALAYLYSFANYEVSRTMPRTDLKLSRVRRLLELAGNPQDAFRSIIIAGTKGKGSTAAMLASMSQAAGGKTGLYSTPHLNSHRERIQLDGRLIAIDKFVRLVDCWKRVVERFEATAAELGQPTTYELGTGIAFSHFAEESVDLAVIEVGLGGRLDATNVLDAQVSVITPISYDHTDVLGPTLAHIAREKAGIIKPGHAVITAPQPQEAMRVLDETAAQRHSPIRTASPAASVGSPAPIVAGRPLPAKIGQAFLLDAGLTGQDAEPYWTALLGQHQLVNAGTAAAAAVQLGLAQPAVKQGLASVRWPGRLEILCQHPLVVADGAHNVDSMEKLAAAVRRHFQYDRLHAIAGFSADKDISGMAAVLKDLADEVILTRSRHPRSADPAAAAARFRAARSAGGVGHALASVEAGPADLVLITGSLYLVGEARQYFGFVPEEDQDPL